MGETNVVPIFKTFDDLQADEQQILADLEREWNEANEVFDSAMAKTAVLKKDMPTDGDSSQGYHRAVAGLKALAKLNPSNASSCAKMIADLTDIEMSHRAVAAEMQNRLAKKEALVGLLRARNAAVEKRDQRLFGFGALAKRSQRFATAQLNKN